MVELKADVLQGQHRGCGAHLSADLWTYSKVALAKRYDRNTLITAADLARR